MIAPYIRRGFEDVDIESQRAAKTAWTYLAFDSVSPYIETRPPLVANQAEQRRYRMRYRDKTCRSASLSIHRR
jgi:hypothetical protein